MASTKEPFIPEHYGNKITTVDNEGKRKWVYAFKPQGKYYNYRTWLSWFYFAVFFALPFIKINGKPILMLNIPRGEFIIFGQLFFPQDFILLGVGMVLAIIFIIVFTLLFGRVFCGWVCPQTIFLEMLFRKIEFWIEGPAHKQMAMARRKDKSADYYVRKAVKHVIFYLLSFIIACTFLSYIIGMDEVISLGKEPIKDHWVGWISLLIFTTVFYSVFAFVREIVCTVICPYGRLQSTIMDNKSMAVSYNFNRGEPRAKGKDRRIVEDPGDCIDCGMCVNVCHVGIDIRDGLQMECVHCTACMDACDMMMRKVGKPEKLITYASVEQLETNTVGQRTWDTRSKLLMALLVVLTLIFTSMVISRPVFDSTVMRVPGQLYQENDDGTITNLYKVKVMSKSLGTLPFSLDVKEPEATLETVGKKIEELESGQQGEEIFFVRFKSEDLKKNKTDIHIQIKSGERVIQTKKVTFMSSY